MTDEQLSEIEAREQAATLGPWQYGGVPYDRYEDPFIFGPNDEYVAQTTCDMQSGSQKHNINEDTIFIAHARQDIPDLLAEVRRLKDALAKALKPRPLLTLEERDLLEIEDKIWRSRYGYGQ